MSKVYVCSDTHFNHTNIIKYCDRPYKDTNEMNQMLINNWNSVVNDDDTVFFLGDFCLGNKDVIIQMGQSLKGKKILVMGNHDHGSKTVYKEAGFESIFKEEVIMDMGELGTIHFSHHPKPESHYLNVHGHTHSTEMFDPNIRNNVCVSMEAIHYTPFPLDKIVEEYNKRQEV